MRISYIVVLLSLIAFAGVCLADNGPVDDSGMLEQFSRAQRELQPDQTPQQRAEIVKKYGFSLQEYEQFEKRVKEDPQLQDQLRERARAAEESQKSTDEDEEMVSKGDQSFSLYGLFSKGGPFMWPILLFAAIAMGYIIERFIFFRKAQLNPREFIEELENTIMNGNINSIEKFCKENNLIISKIIQKGLRVKSLGYEQVEKALAIAGSIEVATLERGLNILSALGNIVPMLGFLGTVSGMISAFSNIAAADQVNARLVAGGIEEALLTTAAGLIVAIPTLAFYNYFVHRIDGFIADVERLSSDILEKLVEDYGKD